MTATPAHMACCQPSTKDSWAARISACEPDSSAADPDITVVRQRVVDPPPDNPSRMRAHPGREWLVVLSGTVTLLLGNRRLRVETNQAAEFPTMLPYALGTAGGPAEILGIFDRDARRGHQDRDEPSAADHPTR